MWIPAGIPLSTTVRNGALGSVGVAASGKDVAHTFTFPPTAFSRCSCSEVVADMRCRVPAEARDIDLLVDPLEGGDRNLHALPVRRVRPAAPAGAGHQPLRF